MLSIEYAPNNKLLVINDGMNFSTLKMKLLDIRVTEPSDDILKQR